MDRSLPGYSLQLNPANERLRLLHLEPQTRMGARSARRVGGFWRIAAGMPFSYTGNILNILFSKKRLKRKRFLLGSGLGAVADLISAFTGAGVTGEGRFLPAEFDGMIMAAGTFRRLENALKYTQG